MCRGKLHLLKIDKDGVGMDSFGMGKIGMSIKV